MSDGPAPCIQEVFAPKLQCFGCGPANSQGLRIRSFPEGEELVARWKPEKHHEAYPGMLSGGIIGTVLDCHCNWTAAYRLMVARGEKTPPCTVTAEYAITMKRPTPTADVVLLRARVVEIQGDRVVVEGTLEAEGKLRATCRGTFVAVQPGHPAYHRW
jgi:acyl-coenzyme A thioesterase PaaI-like protein